MTLSKTYPEARRAQGGVNKGLYDLIDEVDKSIEDIEAGTVPAGSISTEEIANLAITEGKIATSAITSGKIADGSISAAKLRGDMKGATSAGVTITALTAAFGDPATLPSNFLGFIKDSSDSNHIRAVVVVGGAFYYGGVYTAAV
jgi:hypothetical protein